MRESLENVRVGNLVIEFWRGERKIAKVTRVTKTQIEVNGWNRYRKNGMMVGGCDDLWPRQIRLPKEGEIEEIQRLKFVNYVISKMRMLGDRDVTYEQAVKIKEVLGL